MASQVSFEDEAIQRIVAEYTAEAGVRQLERQLGTVVRKIAARVASSGDADGSHVVRATDLPDYLGPPRFHQEVALRVSRPGVATGVAWTEAGGDVLFIEASILPAGHHDLILNGQLGSVMQKSARAALRRSASRRSSSTRATCMCTFQQVPFPRTAHRPASPSRRPSSRPSGRHRYVRTSR